MRGLALAGGPQPADLFYDDRYVGYHDADWDWRTFDPRTRRAAKAHAYRQSTWTSWTRISRPSPSSMRKLLIFHGWADQQVAPGSSVAFYKSVVASSGDASQSANWIRLFMFSWNGGHLRRRRGSRHLFDRISVIEKVRVEQGIPPVKIIASAFVRRADRSHAGQSVPIRRIASYKGV